jgi:hypothetical protein
MEVRKQILRHRQTRNLVALVSMNFDRLLEKVLAERGQPFEVIVTETELHRVVPRGESSA